MDGGVVRLPNTNFPIWEVAPATPLQPLRRMPTNKPSNPRNHLFNLVSVIPAVFSVSGGVTNDRPDESPQAGHR